MALRVEIDEKQAIDIDERSGNKNGRDWSIRTQSIWMYQPGAKFPIQINFMLPEGVNSYPSGAYTLNLDLAVDQGNFKSLILDTRRLQLVPTGSKC